MLSSSPPRNEDRLWADSEIVRLDDDHFGYRDYAKVLAHLIGQAGTPLVIGVFGPWGSGKTSLMHLIRTVLEQRRSSIQTIWLNVWQLSNQEELWNAFLQALLTTVHGRMPFYRRWAFDLSLLARRVRWGVLFHQLLVNSYRILIVIIPMLLVLFGPKQLSQDQQSPQSLNRWIALLLDPWTGGAVSLFLGLWLLVKPVVHAARDVVSLDLGKALKEASYETRVSTLQHLQSEFARLVHKWVGDNGRLVVFVDDLDRCIPDKAPEVLEAIKLFTTTPGCIYLLGMDYNMLRRGIAERYKFDEDEAISYLEKIVQIPFHLPPLEYKRIAAFVRKAYPHLVEKCATIPQIFSVGLEHNPRQVKRVLNIYRTLLAMAEYRQVAWDIETINQELLAKIVVIQARFPRLHEYLIHDPWFLAKLDDLDNVKRSWSDRLIADVRRTLLEHPSQDGKHTSLVEISDIDSLVNMLDSGEAYFKELAQTKPGQAELPTYIYLTGTTVGTVEHLRPKREDRDALLCNDAERVRLMAESLLARGENEGDLLRYFQVYRPKLLGVLENPESYQQSERLSSNWALVCFDLLEGVEQETAYLAGIKRLEKDPYLYRLLVDLYIDQNRLREAFEALSIALSLDPRNPKLRSLRKELSRPAPRRGRHLTMIEINEAQLVFGDGLAYNRVRLVENARFPGMFEVVGRRLRGLPPAPIQTALTLGNTCYFTTSLGTSEEQIANGEIAEMAWLIHELTHVWHYKRMGWGFLPRMLQVQFSVGQQAYDYGSEKGLIEGRKAGHLLQDFNLEQQGDIARDYYLRLKSGQDVSAWQPFIHAFVSNHSG